MQTFKSLIVFASVISSVVAGDVASINAPLTKEQIAFRDQQAPILIQPNFEAGVDNLQFFDFAETTKFTFNPDNIDAARAKLTTTSVGGVDWDYIEYGGAISLNFLFFRPLNSGDGRGVFSGELDRRADTESGILLFKQPKVGPSSVVGFPKSPSHAFSNAHGAAIAAACSADDAKCMVPDFSKGVSLSSELSKQAKGSSKGRVFEVLDGRVAFVADHHSHATVVVTDHAQLVKDINMKSTVVYYPEGADIAETKKVYSGATFVAYKFRDKELSEIILANAATIVSTKYLMQPTDAVESWTGAKVQLKPGVGSSLRYADGSDTGANGPWGWGMISIVGDDGKARTPKSYNEKKVYRPHFPALHAIMSRSMINYFTEDEIKSGALKPVRNGWMVAK